MRLLGGRREHRGTGLVDLSVTPYILCLCGAAQVHLLEHRFKCAEPDVHVLYENTLNSQTLTQD